MRPTAIVRSVGDSYHRATRGVDHGPIDVALARRQHDAYVAALGTLGYNVRHPLPADESQPDGVFVEDQAVVIGSRSAESASAKAAELGFGLTGKSNPDAALAGATPYLRLFGLAAGGTYLARNALHLARSGKPC